MNNILGLPDSNSHASSGWFTFLLILMGVGVIIALVTIWLLVFRGKKNKKRRKRRHRRHRQNPTLAETGGLPPPRDPNQPPSSL